MPARPDPARDLPRPETPGTGAGQGWPAAASLGLSPTVDEEAIIMRMRMGASLLVAVVGLFVAAQNAAASHCGAASYSCCSQPCCDAQSNFGSFQGQNKACYK